MKFRKKPVVIEAVQFTNELALSLLTKKEPPLFGKLTPSSASWHEGTGVVNHASIHIETLEGTMRADIGDWIIKGINGELYPCKDDVFRATYESLDD
jgi:hypothetical protein